MSWWAQDQTAHCDNTIQKKHSHTDLYSHIRSKHHTLKKWTVLTILLQLPKPMYNYDSLDMEINQVQKTFRYNEWQSWHVCPCSKTKLSNKGEARRHSYDTRSTSCSEQHQYTPCQIQHQGHPHSCEEKHLHTETYKRQTTPKSQKHI